MRVAFPVNETGKKLREISEEIAISSVHRECNFSGATMRHRLPASSQSASLNGEGGGAIGRLEGETESVRDTINCVSS